MAKPQPNEDYSPKEAQRRFEAALRAALNTPPKPMKELPKKRSGKKKAASADSSS